VTVDGDTKVEGGNGSQLLVLVTEGPEGHRSRRLRSGQVRHDILPHSTRALQAGGGDVESINTLAEWVEVGSQM